ncbi:MAG TPA: DUF5996 family protein [Candidatus Tumulicola sp.]|jgi:hypothetical protein
MTEFAGAWPPLPLEGWRDTCDTLHMYAQIVGKIRLALSPPEPQWAHVAMYVTPHGLTTGPIPFENRTFQIDFDFVEHRVRVVASDGRENSLELRPRSVAEFYRTLMQMLNDLDISVRIWPMPVEVSNPIRFDRDDAHAAYDPRAARRFAEVLAHVDAAMKEHRAPFRRRHTLVQFFFGSFDLAYARFSGRPATPPSDDVIMANAMDAQEICAGFWPGDDRFPEPTFWCYAFPKPPGSERLAVRPSAAFWSDAMGEFVLRYEDVRSAESPRAALREFLTSTFEGFAELADWPTA